MYSLPSSVNPLCYRLYTTSVALIPIILLNVTAKNDCQTVSNLPCELFKNRAAPTINKKAPVAPKKKAFLHLLICFV